jgi:hypothetical protein
MISKNASKLHTSVLMFNKSTGTGFCNKFLAFMALWSQKNLPSEPQTIISRQQNIMKTPTVLFRSAYLSKMHFYPVFLVILQ